MLTGLLQGKKPVELARERKVTSAALSKICGRAVRKLGATTLYQAVAVFARQGQTEHST